MINRLDYQVSKFFHNVYLWGGQFANGFMKGISFIAEAGILFLLVGLALAVFKRTRKAGCTILLSVAIGFLLTNVILKPIISRARPFEDISSDFYGWWLDAGPVNESGHSFPSGHTTATTAFAVALFITMNKKYSWPILLLPVAMASSRIYLMVHYFSDCLGGFVVGSAAALIAWLIVKLIYASKVRLFVWMREFDVFKPKGINALAPKTTTPKPSKDPVEQAPNLPKEDFVYSTQQEEQSSTNPTEPVEKETTKTTHNKS